MSLLLWGGLAGATAVLTVGSYVLGWRHGGRGETAEGTLDVDELPDDPDHEEHQQVVELPAPTTGGRGGVLGDIWRGYQHVVRQRRLAKKGYVRWIKIENGVWKQPKYVKPSHTTRSKYPEHRDGDEVYELPAEALVTDERTGMRTCIHREGEAEPVNLDEADGEVLSAKDLEQLEQMKVSTSPPSLLDRLDLDLSPRLIMTLGIAATMIIAVVLGAV